MLFAFTKSECSHRAFASLSATKELWFVLVLFRRLLSDDVILINLYLLASSRLLCTVNLHFR